MHKFPAAFVCAAAMLIALPPAARADSCGAIAGGTGRLRLLARESYNEAPAKTVTLEIERGATRSASVLDTDGVLLLTHVYKGLLAASGRNHISGRDYVYDYEIISGAPAALDIGSASVYRQISRAEGKVFADETVSQIIAGASVMTVAGCSVSVLAIETERRSALDGSSSRNFIVYSPDIGYTISLRSTGERGAARSRHDFDVVEILEFDERKLPQ